jgi:tetratricopeptide (TPR) repeat protein
MAEREFGPDHSNVAASLNNLAGIYRAQGQYALARPLLKRALVINETALGLDHLSIATSLSGLAALYEERAEYARAEPRYKRALEIWINVLGSAS